MVTQCFNVHLIFFDNYNTLLDFFCNSEAQFDSCLTKNFAYSQHKNQCHGKIKLFNYHVIAAVDQLPHFFRATCSKPFIVPCLLTCFQLLIRGSSHIMHYGDVMEKLQEEVGYDNQHNLIVSNSKEKITKCRPDNDTMFKLKPIFCLPV